MNLRHIAAIEIGSSRIRGVVAAISSNGRIKIIAVEESDAGDAVRHGRVQNAREVSNRVNDIIRRLEYNPKIAPGRISTVFVSTGGRSLISVPTDATLKFSGPEEITKHTLDRLNKEARYNVVSNRDIMEIMPKRFFIDSTETKNIVGTYGSAVRGEYTAITISPDNRRALDRVDIKSHNEELSREYITRLLAQTEMALTDSDRQIGCIYIDFGAETTTLAAFKDDALIFAVTLPIGGANITRDLSSALSVTAEEAKNIKHTKGEAVVDRNKFEAPDIEIREIVNYVSSRAGEILANVTNILDLRGLKISDFASGIVISGGGIQLKGFPKMVEAHTKAKVRIASVDPLITSDQSSVNLPDNFDLAALVKYAAKHFNVDCVSFTENAQPLEDVNQQPQAKPIFQDKGTKTPQRGRRPIQEDDRNLLEDDPDYEQPDNINDVEFEDELPEKGKNPGETRRNLIEKIKKIKKIFTLPVDDYEGPNMD